MPKNTRRSRHHLPDFLMALDADETQLEMFETSNVFGIAMSMPENYGSDCWRGVEKGLNLHLVEVKVGIKGKLEQDKDGDFYEISVDKDGDKLHEYDVFDSVAKLTLEELYKGAQENPEMSLDEYLKLKFMHGRMKI